MIEFRAETKAEQDSVNYCIRKRQNAIIDTTVAHQQAYFRRAMDSGLLATAGAQAWFQKIASDISRSSENGTDPQSTLASGIIELVMSRESNYPSTFSFDIDRLRCLQTHYRYKLRKEIIRRTLAHFATRSKCERPGASTMSSQYLLSRIDALVEPTDLASNWNVTASIVAIEIARCLPEFNNSKTLPTADVLREVETFLSNAGNEHSTLHSAAQKHLSEKLRPLVMREMKSCKQMTLTQLANRCRFHPHQGQAPMSQQMELGPIAQKITHLSILHWRIWGSILYAQPLTMYHSPDPEATSRVAELNPRGSCVPNSPALSIISTDGMSHTTYPPDNRLI